MKRTWSDSESLIALVDRERTARFARGNILLQGGRFTSPRERTFDVKERLETLRKRFNQPAVAKTAKK